MGRNTAKLESCTDTLHGQEESAWIQCSLLNRQLSSHFQLHASSPSFSHFRKPRFDTLLWILAGLFWSLPVSSYGTPRLHLDVQC